MKLPGTRAIAFASRWFDPATVHHTFDPLIADWQREWLEAPASQRPIVRIHGTVSLVVAAASCSISIMRTAVPPKLANRIAVRAARFTLIGTAVLLLPAVFSLDLGGRWYLLLFQVPAAMAMIFPFAMIGAADEIRTQDKLPAHVARASAAKLAVISVLTMVIYGGFVVPAANHTWRVATSPDRDEAPIAGVRELSTLTLITDQSRVPAYEAFTGGRERAARIRGELQQRAAMALLPLTLLWLRWTALGAPRRGWFQPLAPTGAVAVVLTVFAVTLFAGWRLELALAPGSGAGVWLPIVVLSLLEALAGALRKRTAPEPA